MWLDSTTTSTTAAAAGVAAGSDVTNGGDAVAAAAARGGDAATVKGSGGGGAFVTSGDDIRIQGRPGSQGGGEIFLPSSGEDTERSGGGERTPARPGTAAVEAEELLRAYGDRFDVVACGGHSMDLVTDFVRHFVGSSSPDGVARQQ